MPNEVGKGQKKAPQEQEEDIISLANLFSFFLSFIFFFPFLSPQFSLSNLRVCAHQARPRSDNFSPNTSHLRLGSRQVRYFFLLTWFPHHFISWYLDAISLSIYAYLFSGYLFLLLYLQDFCMYVRTWFYDFNFFFLVVFVWYFIITRRNSRVSRLLFDFSNRIHNHISTRCYVVRLLSKHFILSPRLNFEFHSISSTTWKLIQRG